MCAIVVLVLPQLVLASVLVKLVLAIVVSQLVRDGAAVVQLVEPAQRGPISQDREEQPGQRCVDGHGTVPRAILQLQVFQDHVQYDVQERPHQECPRVAFAVPRFL